jgi:two-component system LytT family response regulator
VLPPPPPPPGGYAILAVRAHRRFLVVSQRTITYLTSLGGVVTIYADAGRFWTDLTLAEVERRLDPRRFLRLDASHLVNVTRIAELLPETHQRYLLRFADAAKTELVMSRDVGRRLRAALGW